MIIKMLQEQLEAANAVNFQLNMTVSNLNATVSELRATVKGMEQTILERPRIWLFAFERLASRSFSRASSL
jgi:hypothetical protein